MKGFNKVIIAGNLTRDPELRYTPRGIAVARIGLAVTRSWKDAETGETKEEVTFVDVDAFGKSAETIGQYLKKGKPILVEGRLKQDSWEDKNTKEKRYRLFVVLETFTFLDSAQPREGGYSAGGGAPGGDYAPRMSQPPRPAARPAPNSPPPQSSPDPDGMPPEDDDVPF
ncbi:MAG: single-stranded DNA-binding protein [Verrucomicrobiales bacterium]